MKRTALLLTLAALATAAGCASGVQRTKTQLANYGEVVAEWQVRDDYHHKTYNYVMLRLASGDYETHEIMEADGYRSVQLEKAGGINADGCFLYNRGFSSYVTKENGEYVSRAQRTSTNERLASDCAEYRDTPAWQFVPERPAAP